MHWQHHQLMFKARKGEPQMPSSLTCIHEQCLQIQQVASGLVHQDLWLILIPPSGQIPDSCWYPSEDLLPSSGKLLLQHEELGCVVFS